MEGGRKKNGGREGWKENVSKKSRRREFTGAVVLGTGLRLRTGLPRVADPLSRHSGVACVSNYLLENKGESGGEPSPEGPALLGMGHLAW